MNAIVGHPLKPVLGQDARLRSCDGIARVAGRRESVEHGVLDVAGGAQRVGRGYVRGDGGAVAEGGDEGEGGVDVVEEHLGVVVRTGGPGRRGRPCRGATEVGLCKERGACADAARLARAGLVLGNGRAERGVLAGRLEVRLPEGRVPGGMIAARQGRRGGGGWLIERRAVREIRVVARRLKADLAGRDEHVGTGGSIRRRDGAGLGIARGRFGVCLVRAARVGRLGLCAGDKCKRGTAGRWQGLGRRRLRGLGADLVRKGGQRGGRGICGSPQPQHWPATDDVLLLAAAGVVVAGRAGQLGAAAPRRGNLLCGREDALRVALQANSNANLAAKEHVRAEESNAGGGDEHSEDDRHCIGGSADGQECKQPCQRQQRGEDQRRAEAAGGTDAGRGRRLVGHHEACNLQEQHGDDCKGHDDRAGEGPHSTAIGAQPARVAAVIRMLSDGRGNDDGNQGRTIGKDGLPDKVGPASSIVEGAGVEAEEMDGVDQRPQERRKNEILKEESRDVAIRVSRRIDAENEQRQGDNKADSQVDSSPARERPELTVEDKDGNKGDQEGHADDDGDIR
eukprot:m.51274 g.51274  ORF g.51274 m.51274 type:complete len:567 (-) comp6294_c0_seq2:344-2044(-)